MDQLKTVKLTFGTEYWAGLFTPILLIALIAPATLGRAYVLCCLWRWYVELQFGVSPLRMPFAFGLALMCRFVLGGPNGKSDGDRNMFASLGLTLLGCLFVILLGWLGTLFI